MRIIDYNYVIYDQMRIGGRKMYDLSALFASERYLGKSLSFKITW